MSEETTESQSLQILRSYVNQIHEHLGADSVQIFATKVFANGDTAQLTHGTGNYYSRKGLVESWLESEKAVNSERALEQMWFDDELNCFPEEDEDLPEV